jgi:flagellar biosynthetic protein FlhB
MSDNDGGEKSHDASFTKLEEARKKGELVRSADLNTAAAYAGFLVSLLFGASLFLGNLSSFFRNLLEHPEAFKGILAPRHGSVIPINALWVTVGSVAVFFVLPAIGTCLSLVGQKAIVIAPTKIAPKISKLSILQNAKQKFGPSGLFEFFKSFVKLCVISCVLATFLFLAIDRIVGTVAAAPAQMLLILGDMLTQFILIVVVVSGLIGGVDYLWQRHSHLKKQMMTRQEVLDEHKTSEGDPHVKAQRRQRAHEIVLNKMLADVPNASVIVVNPTHYAVALQWSPSDSSPPVCLAKGVDEIAARIREIAAEHGIPIHRDPPTARALFATVDVGDSIDRQLFGAVAVAIRFAGDMRKKARARGAY